MTGALIALIALFTRPAVVINTATQTATVYSLAGTETFPVATGKTGWDTPTGFWHVTEVDQAPGPAYGPYALVTDAPGRADSGFGGVIAIHGTNQPGLLGRAVSHGCIRTPNQTITALVTRYHAGTGTPVLITNQPKDK